MSPVRSSYLQQSGWLLAFGELIGDAAPFPVRKVACNTTCGRADAHGFHQIRPHSLGEGLTRETPGKSVQYFQWLEIE